MEGECAAILLCCNDEMKAKASWSGPFAVLLVSVVFTKVKFGWTAFANMIAPSHLCYQPWQTIGKPYCQLTTRVYRQARS